MWNGPVDKDGRPVKPESLSAGPLTNQGATMTPEKDQKHTDLLPLSLDDKIYAYIKSIKSDWYLGRELREIEKKFSRETKEPFKSDVWAALSRLSQSGKIRKSGSHRYKAYKVVEEN